MYITPYRKNKKIWKFEKIEKCQKKIPGLTENAFISMKAFSFVKQGDYQNLSNVKYLFKYASNTLPIISWVSWTFMTFCWICRSIFLSALTAKPAVDSTRKMILDYLGAFFRLRYCCRVCHFSISLGTHWLSQSSLIFIAENCSQNNVRVSPKKSNNWAWSCTKKPVFTFDHLLVTLVILGLRQN